MCVYMYVCTCVCVWGGGGGRGKGYYRVEIIISTAMDCVTAPTDV